MKMVRIKKILSFLMAIVLCIVFSGCGATTVTESVDDELSSNIDAQANTGNVAPESIHVVENKDIVELSFSWWGSDDRHQYTMAAIKEFENQNPNIKVNCTYSAFDSYEDFLKQAIASKTVPDVVTINYNWIHEYTDNGSILNDLKDYTDIISLDAFSADSLKLATLDGRVIGLPVATSVETYFYNKSIYDKYGIEIPKSFDDLKAAAEVMKKDKVYPLVFGSKAGFLMAVSYAEQISGHKYMTLDGELQFDETDVENMIFIYKDLLESDVCCNVENYDKAMLADGTAAGLLGWVSDGAAWNPVRDAGDEVVIGDYVSLDGKSNPIWYSKPASLYCMSSQTQHPQEAARLLEFIASSEAMMEQQKSEKGIPGSIKAQEYLKAKGYLDNSLELIATEKYNEYEGAEQMSYFMEDTDVVNAYFDAANKVIYKDAGSKDAAVELLKQMRDIIATKRK